MLPHIGAAMSQEVTPDRVYEYTITLKQEDGSVTTDTVVAVDDDHAREEASYECEGEILAVTKGPFLYLND